MKQRINKNFGKYEYKKVDYIFSYNLFKAHNEIIVGNEGHILTDSVAKKLDGKIIRIRTMETKVGFCGGYLIAPQWAYPIKFDAERRYREFHERQRWSRGQHSGRVVIIG